MAESQFRTEGQTIAPPRFVWLRRGAIGFTLLLLTLVVLRLWWGHEANQRIAELGRAAHLRGEPFYPEDFQEESIPDDKNAAVPIKAAVIGTAAARGGWPIWVDGAPAESDLASMEAFLAKYRPEMKLVRTARRLPDASWDLDRHYPYRPVPQRGGNRTLAVVLVTSAKIARAREQDGPVVDYIADELALTNVWDRACPSIPPYVGVIGMSDLGASFVRSAAMDLKVSEDPDSGATSADVRNLIVMLLDERELALGAVRAFYGERASVIQDIPNFASAGSWLGKSALRPLFVVNAARIAEMRTAEAEACRHATWTAAQSRLKFRGDQSILIFKYFSYPMIGNDVPLDEVVKNYFEMLVNRRAAAIMLALRLYQVDHHGLLPQSLSELVPSYLRAIPNDPFDPADGSIRYLPHRRPPALYSVGPNGVDDHGSQKTYLSEDLANPPWDTEDAVFLLEAKPRIAPPQSQPSN